jgi:hypothetical protein
MVQVHGDAAFGSGTIRVRAPRTQTRRHRDTEEVAHVGRPVERTTQPPALRHDGGGGGMNTWEYLIVALPPFEPASASKGHSPAVETLDREGAQGWEAVGMTTLPDRSVAVLLKRRAVEDHESQRGRPARPTS